MPAYTVQNLFFSLPEAQVLAIRDNAVAIISGVKTIMEVQSRGGQMSQKAFAMPPKDILAEANAALRYLNPAVYGCRRTRTYARQSGR